MSPTTARRATPLSAGARVLVTGGLGFIGSTLVHRLAARGIHVIAVDALVPEHGGDPRNLDDLPAGSDVDVVVADIGDPAVAAALVGIDVVFNLAGQVNHLASMQEPVRDLDLNVRSHVQFLEMVRVQAPTATIVLTSTRQVYGRPNYLPVDEEHPTVPVDVNGVDKLACERYHLLYGTRYDLSPVVLRLTNVYGPRQHLDREGLGFLPVFVRRALLGEEIVLFGDGSQQRDCVHVDDVVDAMLLAADTPEARGEIFNLGHPDLLSLSAIAQLVQHAAGRGGTTRCVPWPADLVPIDIGSFQADFSKAKRILGWGPRISFADGIRSTMAHHIDRSWSPSST